MISLRNVHHRGLGAPWRRGLRHAYHTRSLLLPTGVVGTSEHSRSICWMSNFTPWPKPMQICEIGELANPLYHKMKITIPVPELLPVSVCKRAQHPTQTVVKAVQRERILSLFWYLLLLFIVYPSGFSLIRFLVILFIVDIRSKMVVFTW